MKEGIKGRLEMSLNPKHSKNLRKHLRNNMTQTEVMLWNKLKGKQLLGYKVRRQYGIADYIVDFYCPRLKLAIEVDGDSHYTRKGKKHDIKRDEFIQNKGIKILRIPTIEVYANLDGVIEYLAQKFKERQDYW